MFSQKGETVLERRVFALCSGETLDTCTQRPARDTHVCITHEAVTLKLTCVVIKCERKHKSASV